MPFGRDMCYRTRYVLRTRSALRRVGAFITLVIYVLIDIVCGFVIGLLVKIPIIGIIFSILGSIIGLYALIGIILTILVFLKVIK